MRNLTATASLLALTLLTGDRFAVAEEKPQPDVAHVDLQGGALAPKFESVDERGQPWSSVDHVGKKYLVVYFYPADFTTGCIKQAETFRDSMNRLSDQGVEVIGVSGDAVRNHQLFKDAWQLNYTLLADETGAAVAGQFGVPVTAGGAVSPFSPDRKPLTDENGQRMRLERKATFARWTFVIGKDGKVVYKNTKVNPVDDAKQVSEFILKLEKEANAAVESGS
jgi:peroxiredoxin Q/BCP